MTTEELLIRDVQEEFSKSRSYFRVAKALGIGMAKVKAILADNTPVIERRKALFNGQGRPELRQYIVAIRHSDTPEWDNTSEEISEARSAYEAGTHEMCTGYDGDYTILYSIPRSIPQPRPGYFYAA